MAVDRAAEDAALAVLERLAGEGERASRSSPRRSASAATAAVAAGASSSIRSTAASMRSAGFRCYALSVAVADGPSMADVALGYVYDLGNGEEWIARRGGGASVDGAPLSEARPQERLQLVALEAGLTEHLVPCGCSHDGRRRARSACSAPSRSLSATWPTAVSTPSRVCARAVGRAIDIAAAQLVVREAGSVIALPDAPGPFAAAPLDLQGRSRVVAAGDERSLARVAALLGIGPGGVASRPIPGSMPS